jgi:hypothetical protein
MIGSIRRDCLDHVIVFGERHLRRLLNSYQRYYNEVRTHVSVQKDAPIARDVQRTGRVIPVPTSGRLTPPIYSNLSFRQGQPFSARGVSKCDMCSVDSTITMPGSNLR